MIFLLYLSIPIGIDPGETNVTSGAFDGLGAGLAAEYRGLRVRTKEKQ
jgi:hypothetical protein